MYGAGLVRMGGGMSLLVPKCYGDEADIESAIQAEELAEAGDWVGEAFWRRVIDAIGQRENTTPHGPLNSLQPRRHAGDPGAKIGASVLEDRRPMILYRTALGFALALCMLLAISASAKEYRSPSVKREFQLTHPCPANGRTRGACPGYVKDHVVPLACGGPDAHSNIQ